MRPKCERALDLVLVAFQGFNFGRNQKGREVAPTKPFQVGFRAWLNLMLVPITLISTTSGVFSQDAATTIYIVRHAEKLDSSADSPLSQEGIERAKELAHVLQDADLTTIFVSSRLRTQQTAAPIAEAMGIEPKRLGNPEDIAKAIQSDHVGGHILVVGHSETVDNIAAGLGVDGVPELKPNQYDRIFLVHRVGSESHLHTIRYGELTD